MKALICDAGNTRVRVAGWPGSTAAPTLETVTELTVVGDLETPRKAMGLAAFTDRFNRLLERQGSQPLVLVSVVPSVTRVLTQMYPDIYVVDHYSPLPFDHKIKDLDTVGQDRLCNVAAAAAAGLTNALVVDAGTATTYDLLVDGVFLGGVIAPGMAFAARELGKKAARLEPVPFAKCELIAGADTNTAMSVGAWHTGLGGVQTVIDGLLARYGDLPIILTGGLGRVLEKPGRVFDGDWTLRGAAVLADLV